jgi:Eukaryotic aspartyl protease
MWVLETGCSGIYADSELWDPNSSESAKKQQPFQFKYSDGSIVTGDRYTDNVTIAGFTVCSISLMNMTSDWILTPS